MCIQSEPQLAFWVLIFFHKLDSPPQTCSHEVCDIPHHPIFKLSSCATLGDLAWAMAVNSRNVKIINKEINKDQNGKQITKDGFIHLQKNK